ncbi:hypothetical protein CCB80_07420 [Armatimonadetes bacterium Uphvl-Ar1]|nr:hypothetical protein CCB80_07420 [Armatimonadetes bacterium Uphvl-Ar1]
MFAHLSLIALAAFDFSELQVGQKTVALIGGSTVEFPSTFNTNQKYSLPSKWLNLLESDEEAIYIDLDSIGATHLENLTQYSQMIKTGTAQTQDGDKLLARILLAMQPNSIPSHFKDNPTISVSTEQFVLIKSQQDQETSITPLRTPTNPSFKRNIPREFFSNISPVAIMNPNSLSIQARAFGGNQIQQASLISRGVELAEKYLKSKMDTLKDAFESQRTEEQKAELSKLKSQSVLGLTMSQLKETYPQLQIQSDRQGNFIFTETMPVINFVIEAKGQNIGIAVDARGK